MSVLIKGGRIVTAADDSVGDIYAENGTVTVIAQHRAHGVVAETFDHALGLAGCNTFARKSRPHGLHRLSGAHLARAAPIKFHATLRSLDVLGKPAFFALRRRLARAHERQARTHVHAGRNLMIVERRKDILRITAINAVAVAIEHAGDRAEDTALALGSGLNPLPSFSRRTSPPSWSMKTGAALLPTASRNGP